jgi:hypothetical protein
MTTQNEESPNVYSRLLEAAGDDPQQANVYFLGDGITISLNQRITREKHKDDEPDDETKVAITLIDERSGEIVSAAVEPRETSIGDGFIVPFKSVSTDRLAELCIVGKLTPAESSQTYSWQAAKDASLATPERPEIDLVAIRTLLGELANRQ